MRKVLLATAMAIGLLLATPRASSAELFTFSCITSDATTDCGILEAQLAVDVRAGDDPNEVEFHFTNTGGSASSVFEIYFDDPIPMLLAASADISSSAGASFSPGCNPGDLPDGNDPLIGFASVYCADRTGNAATGLNPGEFVDITYNLASGYDLADVLAALNDGSYRIGLHVGAFADGGSVSGVNVPNHSVPEPTSLLFVTTGLLLGGLGLNRRRKR